MNAQKELEIKQVILNYPELEESLATVESIADIQAVFAQYGCQLTEDDIHEMFITATVSAEEDGELSEEDLDSVAGGIAFWQVKLAWGVGKRVGIGARMIYDHYKYGNYQRTYRKDQLITGSLW